MFFSVSDWLDDRVLKSLRKDSVRAEERVEKLLRAFHRNQDFKGCSELCRARKRNLLEAAINRARICDQLAREELERKPHQA